MEVIEAIRYLGEHPDFKAWKKNNEDTYFSYAFNMIEEGHENPWQLGFYDKKKDRLTSFIVTAKQISINSEEEVFKAEHMEVLPIETEKIKTKVTEILNKAADLQKKEHKTEKPVKIIIILQKLGDIGLIWNITYVTQTMKILNIKLKAENGEIIEHKLHSLFEFHDKV